MRTTLNINDSLIQSISKYTGMTCKTEIIDRALSELLDKLKRENIKNAYGKMKFELDVRKFRNRELNE